MGGGIYIGAVNVVDNATLLNLRLENNVASNVDDGIGAAVWRWRWATPSIITAELDAEQCHRL